MTMKGQYLFISFLKQRGNIFMLANLEVLGKSPVWLSLVQSIHFFQNGEVHFHVFTQGQENVFLPEA